MTKRETPHGAVSERFMRHHYGASGLVKKETHVESRDAFELWSKSYQGGMVLGRDSENNYTSPYTQTAWDAWKASMFCTQWSRREGLKGEG